MKKLLVIYTALLALTMVSCSDSSPQHAGHENRGHDAAGGENGAVPGTPASPSAATREVKITTHDQLRFEPDRIEVRAGEVVMFTVQNIGKTRHEFVLGDAKYQEMHGKDMQSGHMADGANAVSLEPGETKRLTWEFGEAGTLQFGCHEPGHFEGGMVGEITIQA